MRYRNSEMQHLGSPFRFPGVRPQLFGMIPDVCHNAVPLLRPAAIAIRSGTVHNLGLEFLDSVENGHPALLDRLDAQSEFRAEFRVGFAGEGGAKESLFRRTQAEDGYLVAIERRRYRVR